MKLGAIFPQTEFGDDAGAIREWTLAVEAMGFDHVYVYDHVVGANTASRPDWKGPYNLDSQFYEPLVLFSYMAAVSQKLAFVSGVVILPQRQTALFAKQAACVDVLCEGRLRVGIGTGWNQVEYEALGVSYEDRGDIFDEQIEVMRALWTQRAVTLKLRHHTITDAGIMPMPIQRPIPIWLGGGGVIPINRPTGSERVLRRVGRVADGWLPVCAPDATGLELKERIYKYAREAGRDPSQIGIEGRIDGQLKNQDRWADEFKAWKDFGSTHFSINTLRDGLIGPEQHLRRLEDVRKVLP
jgi:probable F420-dependent oxidoreductase